MSRKKPKGFVRVSPRMQSFLDGDIKVEDLDDEEIQRGQMRAADGTFRGRPQDSVPRKFFDEVTREQHRRWEAKVQAELEPSLAALRGLRDGARVASDTRYKSAVYLIERAIGKVPDKVEARVEVAQWEQDIEGLLYDDEQERKKKAKKKKKTDDKSEAAA